MQEFYQAVKAIDPIAGILPQWFWKADSLQKALRMIRENGKEPKLCRVDLTEREAEEEGLILCQKRGFGLSQSQRKRKIL